MNLSSAPPQDFFPVQENTCNILLMYSNLKKIFLLYLRRILVEEQEIIIQPLVLLPRVETRSDLYASSFLQPNNPTVNTFGDYVPPNLSLLKTMIDEGLRIED